MGIEQFKSLNTDKKYDIVTQAKMEFNNHIGVQVE